MKIARSFIISLLFITGSSFSMELIPQTLPLIFAGSLLAYTKITTYFRDKRLAAIEQGVKEVNKKIDTVSGTIGEVRNDVALVKGTVTSLVNAVAGIHDQNETTAETLNKHGNTLGKIEESQDTLMEQVNRLEIALKAIGDRTESHSADLRFLCDGQDRLKSQNQEIREAIELLHTVGVINEKRVKELNELMQGDFAEKMSELKLELEVLQQKIAEHSQESTDLVLEKINSLSVDCKNGVQLVRNDLQDRMDRLEAMMMKYFKRLEVGDKEERYPLSFQSYKTPSWLAAHMIAIPVDLRKLKLADIN